MAIKTVQIIQDDFDGSEASTVSFSMEGNFYEIDLNPEHTEQLRAAIQPYVEKARRARGGSSTRGRRPSTSPAPVKSSSPLRGRTTSLSEKGLNATEVREWAHANNKPVNERGRIPDALIEEFQAATQTAAEEAPAPAVKRAPAKRAPAKAAGRQRAKKAAPEMAEAAS